VKPNLGSDGALYRSTGFLQQMRGNADEVASGEPVPQIAGVREIAVRIGRELAVLKVKGAPRISTTEAAVTHSRRFSKLYRV